MISIQNEQWDLGDLLTPEDFRLAIAEKLRKTIPLSPKASLMIAVSFAVVGKFAQAPDTSLQEYIDFLSCGFAPDNLRKAEKRLLVDDWLAPIMEDVPDQFDQTEIADWTVNVRLIFNSFWAWAFTNPSVLTDSKDKEEALSTLMAEFAAAFVKQLDANAPHLEKRARQRGLLGLEPIVN
jgi:hypothetical protein